MGCSHRAWRNGGIGLFLFLAAPLLAVDGPPAVLRDFSKGLQTTMDSTLIDDGASPALVNVDVENGSIEKRGGSVAVSSSSLGGYGQPVRFLYEYIEPDGDRWVISASSATLFKSNNGGQDNSVLTSTHGFTTSSQYCAVTAFGTMRLTDGTTSWITFNGTSVGVSTSAPKGKTCAFMGDRVWTSVGSTLYATNVDDVDDWTVTTSSGDADAIEQTVRYNDGQGITCLEPFKDRLLVFKAQSLDAYVRQDDGLSYVLEPISNHIGTTQCNSVVEREGDIIFLGPDAFYKYEPGAAAYKGYSGSVSRISDLIKPTVNSIQQLDSNSTFHIETAQADFSAGTLSQMSADISPGNIVLSSWTATDASTSDFSAFTSSSSVMVNNGRVYLSTNNTNISNYSFETQQPSFPNKALNWTTSGSCGSECGSYRSSSYGVIDGSWALLLTYSGYSYKIYVLDVDGNTLSTSGSYTASTEGWTQRSLDLSSFPGRMIKIKFAISAYPDTVYAISGTFLCSGGSMTWWDERFVNNAYSVIDKIEYGASTIYQGTFTSRSFDTALSSPTWLVSGANYTENGHEIIFQTQSSDDGSSWDTAVTWSTGSAPSSTSKRYIRYVVALSTGGTTSGVALPFVEDVSLAARSSNGTYQGAHFATPVTAFGSFGVTETLNGGQTSYAIYTDTDTSASFANSSTWVSSQTVTSGAVPSITPSSYAFLRASSTITAAAHNPIISELSLALTGGNQAPVWSEYHQGTYLTALSTSSSSGNDSVLNFDRNGAWTLYDHDWYCMKRIQSGSVLGGSNSDGKIYRFRDKSLLNDNGASISWYWRSKDFDFGLPVTDKVMLRYYVTADYASSSDATFSYGVNRGATTSQTLDLDLYAGFFRGIIRPASLTYGKGIQHFFKISGSGVGESCVIRSVTLSPRSETNP